MAPHPRESFILPSRGANLAPGKAAGGGGSLRPTPGKALFLRRGGANLAPGKASGGHGSLRPTPGKALFLRRGGANLAPGKAAGGGESLRPTPGKALFLRRGAQTLRREKPPAAVRVCASLPGKPYSSVEGRKPCVWKSRCQPGEFAPHSRESLILPSRGANLLPGRASGGRGSLRPTPGKALFHRRGAQTLRPAAGAPKGKTLHRSAV